MVRSQVAREGWTLVFGIILLAVSAQADDREVFVRVCTRCHCMTSYVPSQRSGKAWELTVQQMKQYAENDEAMKFSQDEAQASLRFLASYPEDQALQLEPMETAAVSPTQSPEPKAEPSLPVQPVLADTQTAGFTLARLAPPPVPRVSLRMLAWAKITGYVAIVLLAMMVLSGLMRRRMKKGFRPVHIGLAVAMAFCAIFHSAVFVWRYGTPGILWFWFGLAALAVIVAALAGGYWRSRMGGLLFRFHKAAAWGGLTLTVLHWVWYFL